MLQYFYKFLLFFLTINFSASSISAQSHLSVGVFVAPTAYHVQYPEYTFYTYQKLNYSAAYGINFDFTFNKYWSVSIRPSYSSQSSYSNCIDTNQIYTNCAIKACSFSYVISDTDCKFSKNIFFDYFELPVLVKYNINHVKFLKIQTYLYLGNTFRYFKTYKDVTTVNKTNKIFMDSEYNANDVTFFMPTIGAGFEFSVSNKITGFTDLYYKTQSSDYFKNFTVGLTLGAKANL